jgi:hypothetical protein
MEGRDNQNPIPGKRAAFLKFGEWNGKWGMTPAGKRVPIAHSSLCLHCSFMAMGVEMEDNFSWDWADQQQREREEQKNK